MPSWTPRLPISFQAGTAPKAAPDPQTLPVARLQVIDHPDDQGPALVTRATADGLGFRGTKFFLCLAHGSDCVLTAAVADDGSVGDGQIAATEAQQHNLHLGVGLQEEFRCACGLGLGPGLGRAAACEPCIPFAAAMCMPPRWPPRSPRAAAATHAATAAPPSVPQRVCAAAGPAL